MTLPPDILALRHRIKRTGSLSQESSQVSCPYLHPLSLSIQSKQSPSLELFFLCHDKHSSPLGHASHHMLCPGLGTQNPAGAQGQRHRKQTALLREGALGPRRRGTNSWIRALQRKMTRPPIFRLGHLSTAALCPLRYWPHFPGDINTLAWRCCHSQSHKTRGESTITNYTV